MSSLELRRSSLLVRKMLLQTMPDELMREFEAVSERNGQMLAGTIERRAPESEDDDPGQLKRSVKYEREGTKVTVTAGGPEAPHATWVNFGTRFMRGIEFFFSSYRLLKRRLWGGYGRALTKVAKKYSAT